MKEPRTCHYCGARAPDVVMTRDHIVPRAKGGANQAWNVVDACEPCNVAKGQGMPKCHCETCERAVARWRMGERGLPRAATARQRPIPADDVPPELKCLSPAMRDLLMRLRTNGAAS